MKIRPLQDRVIVKRVQEEEKTKGGIIIPDTAKEKPIEGEIIAVGNGKILEDGKVRPLDIKPGDRVLFSKYAGTEIKIVRPDVSNLPVGLIPGAAYECGHGRLAPNDRLILVTDGVTEAENCTGEFFDNPRLEEVAARSCDMEDIFAAISEFSGTTPLTDDCTVVDLLYTGPR